jgi:hypothetical protein
LTRHELRAGRRVHGTHAGLGERRAQPRRLAATRRTDERQAGALRSAQERREGASVAVLNVFGGLELSRDFVEKLLRLALLAGGRGRPRPLALHLHEGPFEVERRRRQKVEVRRSVEIGGGRDTHDLVADDLFEVADALGGHVGHVTKCRQEDPLGGAGGIELDGGHRDGCLDAFATRQVVARHHGFDLPELRLLGNDELLHFVGVDLAEELLEKPGEILERRFAAARVGHVFRRKRRTGGKKPVGVPTHDHQRSNLKRRHGRLGAEPKSAVSISKAQRTLRSSPARFARAARAPASRGPRTCGGRRP